jgi:NCAIR mutase (PurE)-related protein
MDLERLQAILNTVARGELSPEQALDTLRDLPFEDLGFAKVDLHRALRQGMPEVIFCPGKTSQQVVEICKRLKQHHALVLASRATPEQATAVLAQIPEAVYHELGKMIVCGSIPNPDESLPSVAVLTAGTADLPVAEETAIVLQSQGVPVLRLSDVGVAGIHRLLGNVDTLRKASVIVVVAGMDGALPSVVGGLVDIPVIAVPTSVGYGASFHGLAALLTMLNSCAAGITVCNIDNGFGAAVAAFRMVRSIRSAKLSACPDQ